MLDAWVREVRTGWGERAYRSVSAVAPVLCAGDLQSVGHLLATDGHQLDDVLGWFRHLAPRSKSFRRRLERGGIIDITSGWAGRVLHYDFGADSVAPLEVLRLRVQQHVELCRSVGEAPGRNLAIVVIEGNGSPSCAPQLRLHARRTFVAGETMAATPSGKLLVLVRRDDGLRSRTLRLADAMRHDDQLDGPPVRVWIEPLSMAAEHIDSHLVGLAS